MTSTPTTQAAEPTAARGRRRTPFAIHIAAWSVPLLVLTEFTMLAVIPVAIIVIGTLVSTRARALRWWAGLLGAVYAIPLAIWILRPDPAESLSKDMSPVLGGLIVAASIAFLIKLYTRRAR